MKIEWECSDCGEMNETNMTHWKRVRDGQGFEENCEECNAVIGIDIEVNTKTENSKRNFVNKNFDNGRD